MEIFEYEYQTRFHPGWVVYIKASSSYCGSHDYWLDTHRIALFTNELLAKEYCDYKNKENGAKK